MSKKYNFHKDLGKAVFNPKLNHLQIKRLLKVYSEFKNEPLYQQLEKRLQDDEIRKVRMENKKYSTKPKFVSVKIPIASGLPEWEFICVQENKRIKNWGYPLAVTGQGYTRKDSVIESINRGRYSRRVTYDRYTHHPKVTSYAYLSKSGKRIAVRLENRFYKHRNAGKHFHFEESSHVFHLVHTKTGYRHVLSAIRVINELPKLIKDIYKMIKQNKFNFK